MKIREGSAQEAHLSDAIQAATGGARCFEDAAQKYASILYREFAESFVLTRVFITVPYGELPRDNRAFVDDLARASGISDVVTDQMLTLSLAGTSGLEETWNDRRNSKGHLSIPLATSNFVEAIPMMSRLLKELGLGLDWIDSRDLSIVKNVLARLAGTFFVRDASQEKDNKGRPIIAAQDFVTKYGVKSVFGLGGAFVGLPAFTVHITFCRDELKKVPSNMLAYLTKLISSAYESVQEKRIFRT